MKWLLVVLVGIVVGVALGRRPQVVRANPYQPDEYERLLWAWRDLERVDSV